MAEDVLPEQSDPTTVDALSRPDAGLPATEVPPAAPDVSAEVEAGPAESDSPDGFADAVANGQADGEVDVTLAEPSDQPALEEPPVVDATAPEEFTDGPQAEPVPDEEPAEDGSDVAAVLPPAEPDLAPEDSSDGQVPVAAPADDDLTWDALVVALATEPPIPADAVLDHPPVEESEAESVAEDEDATPPEVVAEEPAPADEWPEVTADPEDMSEEDEVAAFWNPPAATAPAPDEAVPVPSPTPAPPPTPLPAPSETGEAAVTPEPWLAEDDEEVIGLRTLAADWIDSPPPLHPTEGWEADGWRDGGKGSRPWRRAVGPLAARWSRMRRGERVNVVLYALTAVSILAMALELLAGPDSLPTDVSTAPAPVVSPTTTRPPSTTITFTIPPPVATEEPAAPAVTSGAPVPARTTPTAAAPDPEPDPEPVTVPPQTTPPPTDAPPTTRRTPPTSSGFPEPTPPVLPTFPGDPPPSVTVP